MTQNNGTNFTHLKRASLGDQVFEAIRDAIIRKELVPGTLYSVSAISEQLGVSRTPVREALLQLATNGVVRFEPNRGVRILQVTTKDIEEIYKLRLLLEVPCAFQAASTIDDEGIARLTEIFTEMERCAKDDDESGFQANDLIFHGLILTISGNDRIVEAVNVSRSQMHAKGLSTTPSRPLIEVLEPHRKLFEAIVARDPAAAGAAAQEHLTSTMRILVEQSLERPEGYELPLTEWFDRVAWMLKEYPGENAR